MRMRREREEAAQPQRLCALLAGLEQPLAVARVPVALGDRQAGELAALVVGKGIKRRAADDRSVVVDHQEVADLRLEQLAAALHERAVCLERLDQREDPAHVLDARRTQLLHRVRGDHRAHAAVGEELEQQRARRAARDEVGASHAGGKGAYRVLDRSRGLRGQAGLLHQRLGFARGELRQHLALAVGGQPVGVHEQLVGLEGDGDVLGHVLPGDIEHLAGRRIADVRHQHHLAGVELAHHRRGVDLAHRARELEVGAPAHADRARGDEIARRDADLRAGHRRARQPLRQQRLELDPQHPGGVLYRHQRRLVGDAQALRVARAHALRFQLGLDLRARAVHQREADAERRQQVHVVDEAREARALREHLAAEGDDEGAAAEGVHVRRHLAEPADEGFGVLGLGHTVIFSNSIG